MFVFPGLARMGKGHRESNYVHLTDKEWSKYNRWKLRKELKRLHEQKDVKISKENNVYVVKLTEKGKMKTIKYKIDEMRLNPPEQWDKKWRLIIYDIPDDKKAARDSFRLLLKRLKLQQLQKSVYLTPYPCNEEIAFIREFYGISKFVQVLTISGLENEEAYLGYFGLP